MRQDNKSNPKILKYKAVVFDMDGVIVDSMPYHFISWYEALRPLGIRISCFEIYCREGERWNKTINDLLKINRIKPSVTLLEQIFAERQKVFSMYFKRRLFEGVWELLTGFKEKGLLLGLVTGTPRQQVNKILPKNIRSIFDCIVAGDEVKKGKPFPEPYLKASSALSISTKEAIVVENAPLGIASAKAAGMFCVALTTSLPARYLMKADIIVESLKDLPKIISWKNSKA
jgi:beta-phosphoglucomutase